MAASEVQQLLYGVRHPVTGREGAVIFTSVCRTFGGHADPVEVSRELLGNVGLAPSRQTHHHDDRGRVGKVGGPTCWQEQSALEQPGPGSRRFEI